MLPFTIAIIALVLLALAFIVPVLFRKSHLEVENYDDRNIEIAKGRLQELKADLAAGVMNQADFDVARQELEKTLAMDLANANTPNASGVVAHGKQLAIVLLIMVPLFAVLVYSQLGRFDTIDAEVVSAQHQQQDDAPQMSMEEAMAKLKQRLETEPENAEGWFMLARSYAALGNFNEAVLAYEQVLHLTGDDAGVLLRYADAMAMRDGGRLLGQPQQIIARALELEPDHPQGLWLAGIADSQSGNFKQALINWYKLQPMLMNDAESLAQLKAMISNAEQQISADELKQVKEQYQTVQSVSVTQAEITVNVTLDAALQDKVNPGDTVFVFARALEGPPMPLAVVRLTAADLPVTVNLNDNMAMMPNMTLSSFDQVRVEAIVSKAGVAKLSPGDLYAEVAPVNVAPAQNVSIVINQIK
ncbi:MAG: c-type cytochrome biogenesis protein CcmI [Gammaproteobacteria bacterium]|nr:MAG: c-type cytochrome biogenesis protein CcmI [Gammaproteobacteria bacterium]